MHLVRGRSALALSVVLALLVLFALPVVASADETSTVDAAAVETEVTEVTAPAEQAAEVAETAPPEDVPAVPEAVPASTEAAPQAVAAVAKTPAPANHAAALGSHFAKKAAAHAKAPGKAVSAAKRPSRATKLSVPDPDKDNEGGGCSGTVGNYDLSDPVVTATTVGGVASTKFAWTVEYNGTDGCENEALSNITLAPCLAANGGNFTHDEYSSNGWYKWEGNPPTGLVLELTFPGTVSSGGSIAPILKKSDDTHTPAVPGPDCTRCDEYTFTTGVSPTTGGSVAVTGDAAPYTNGESITVTPTAAQGYTFSSWSGDGTGTATRSVSFTGTDCTLGVTANFTEISLGDCPTGYTLTTGVSPTAGGSVAVTGDAAPYTNGESITVTPTAAQGYTFSNWSGDGTGTTTRSVSFTGTDCDLEVTATFTPVNTNCQTWTVTVITNGTVTSPNELLTKSNAYATNPNGTVVSAQAPANHSPANQQGTVSGLSNTVCSTTVTMNFSPDQGCVSDCGSPPPPVDLCPNLDGDQAAVPEGMVVDEDGNCVEPIDLCPNLEGDQAAVPEGMVVDEDGNCVEPIDVCPNIDGDQAEVPEDMFINPLTGTCDEEEVLGEIIDRDPKPSKPEPRVDPQEVAPAVLPSNVQAGVLPFTGSSDLLPLVLLAGLLMVAGVALTLRRPAKVKATK